MKSYINMKKVMGGALLGLFLVSLASAQNMTVAPTHFSNCVVLTSNLSYGMRDRANGRQIYDLQVFLNSQGYLNASPTGYFGISTYNAVRAFQRAQGISPVGNVGPVTRAKIQAISCGTTNPNPDNSQQTVIEKAKNTLASKLYISPASISLVSITSVTWPNGCLGIDYGANMACTMALVPGYEVTLGVGSQRYYYHTDTSGNQIVEHNHSPSSSVSLNSISPSSASYGTTVTINGSGFTDSNVVTFSGAGVLSVMAYSSNSLSFVIPQGVSSCEYCKDYRQLNPGTYQINVKNRNGTSNSVTLTITNNTVPTSFSASPSSGTAPLTAYFSMNGFNGKHRIDYGDGATSGDIDLCTGICTAQAQLAQSHTYNSAGTYTAKLYDVTNVCPYGYYCGAGISSGMRLVGETTITVTGQQTNVTFTASPLSGSAPLSVGFGVNGITDNSNYSIDFGDGSQSPVSIIGQALCTAGSTTCNPNIFGANHTYTQSGTYTAKLMYQPPWSCPVGQYCATVMPAPQVLKTLTITVTANQGGNLTASPSSGESPLMVSLNAPLEVLNKMKSCIYSFGWYGSSGNGLTVDWGDGTVSPSNASGRQGQSCTNEVKTHTYTNPGTYTIKVRSWHPGPTDMAVTDWEGVTSVTVAPGSSSGNLSLSASQTSGNAPLNLSFTGSAGGSSYFGGVTIDYGDGSIEMFCYPGQGCNQKTVGHIYQYPGTYQVKLIGSGEGANRISNIITVVVNTGQAAAIFTATPETGSSPLNVSFALQAADNTGGGTYYTISFGDGQAAGFNTGSYSYISHAYTLPGTYTATVTRNTQCSSWECLGPSTVVGTKTITVSGGQTSGVATLSSYPESGYAPLNVSFSASHLGTGTYYTINYGDGSSSSHLATERGVCTQSYPPTCSYYYGFDTSHIYYYRGTYNVTIVNTSTNQTVTSKNITVQ